MKKGCLIAFLVMVGLFVLVMAGGFFAIDSMFNVFRAVPRVDLAERYGDDLAIVIKIDPDQMSVKSMAGEMMQLDPTTVAWFVPYEAAFFIDADVESARRWMTFAVSTRRLGGFISYNMPFTKPGDMGGGFVGGSVSVGDDGVITMNADGTIVQTALEERERRWAERSDTIIHLEGGHAVEMIVNNANGQAYLALEEWLMESVKEAEDQAKARGEEVVFDQENLSTLFYQVKTARITFDMAARDRMEVVVDMECPETMAAGAVLVSSNVMIDRLRESLAKDEVKLEGELEKKDERVFGTLVVTGFDKKMVESGRDAWQGFIDAGPVNSQSPEEVEVVPMDEPALTVPPEEAAAPAEATPEP